jgi:hypothetical protein
MTQLISIAGPARAGKDSTFSILEKYLKVKRIAFADRLKEVTHDLCMKLYGIDTFTQDNAGKEKIRAMLVAVGNTARTDNPRVWINQAVYSIEAAEDAGYIPVITDVRYLNEAIFVQDDNNGILIHVDRVLPDGTLQPPANSFEAENYPILKSRANVSISASNLEELEKQIVDKVLPLILVEK